MYIYIFIYILICIAKVLELAGDYIPSVRPPVCVCRGTLLLLTGCAFPAWYLLYSHAVCVYLEFASVKIIVFGALELQSVSVRHINYLDMQSA